MDSTIAPGLEVSWVGLRDGVGRARNGRVAAGLRRWAMLGVIGASVAATGAALSLVAGGATVDGAAAQVAAIAAQYPGVRAAEMERELIPVAEKLAGADLTGSPVVCGVVLSLVAPGADGRPEVAWQRARGNCAGTRLTRAGAALPSGGPVVVVELRTAWPRMGMRDAAGYAVASAALPSS